MTTAYDAVPYPSLIHPQTHPDRLATLATLFGMGPAPPQACRVLELGCGDGANLFAMAFPLPGSEFVGVDLAATVIEHGLARVRELGFSNVTLRAADAADESSALGQFDYVVAHGLYSWVPPAARDRILAACKARLSPRGVAYVSYNALPGGYLRQMVRDMMIYHLRARSAQGPADRVREARALMRALTAPEPAGESPPPAEDVEAYRAALRMSGRRVERKQDGAFFHDELGEFNTPFYFHEFAADAARHGLQFLGEADYADMRDHGLPPAGRAAVGELAGGDPLALEQYADFARGRRFRQTLLCHADVEPGRTPDPRRVADLYAASPARVLWSGSTTPRGRPSPAGADVTPVPPSSTCFAGPTGATVTTSDPLTQAALRALGESWPVPRRCHELIARVRYRAGSALPADDGAAAERLGGVLLSLYEERMVELRVYRPAFPTAPSDRPVAHAFTRQQARDGDVVVDLMGRAVRLQEPNVRRLLQLLDGTRDRAALARDLAPHAPAPDVLEARLTQLARLALLTA